MPAASSVIADVLAMAAPAAAFFMVVALTARAGAGGRGVCLVAITMQISQSLRSPYYNGALFCPFLQPFPPWDYHSFQTIWLKVLSVFILHLFSIC